VGPVICLEGGYVVAISKLPADFCVKIRKRLPHVRVKLARTGLVGSHVGLRGVIREQFLEDLEVASALHFFAISADDRFCCFG